MVLNTNRLTAVRNVKGIKKKKNRFSTQTDICKSIEKRSKNIKRFREIKVNLV